MTEDRIRPVRFPRMGQYSPTTAVQPPAWGKVFSHVCLSVCPCLKKKRLELSPPKSVNIQSMAGPRHAFTLRSKSLRSNPGGGDGAGCGQAWVCMSIMTAHMSSLSCLEYVTMLDR